MPRNAATGRAYLGINVLILWGEAIAHGYAGQGWLTFRQALAAGGAVREHYCARRLRFRFLPAGRGEPSVDDAEIGAPQSVRRTSSVHSST